MIYLAHENELTWDSEYQVLYFYASWMPFNQKVIVSLGQIEGKFPNVPLFAIDIDYFKGFCRRFDITIVPTILITENGKEVKRIQGVTPSKELATVFDDICTTKPIKYGENL